MNAAQPSEAIRAKRRTTAKTTIMVIANAILLTKGYRNPRCTTSKLKLLSLNPIKTLFALFSWGLAGQGSFPR